MSFTYIILTDGMLKIIQMLTALFYWMVSPFVWDQAKTFTHVYSIVFVGVNLFLTITGGYLLLRRFSSNRIVLNVSTVFLSVFFADSFIVEGNIDQCFIPLLIHLGLNFLEKPSINNMGIFITWMVVTLASGIVHALYDYCGAHFLFLFFFIYSMSHSSRDFKRYFTGIYAQWKGSWRRYIFMVLIWILIMGPYLYIIKFCLNDFYYDAEHSRIKHLLSISEYLSKVVPPAPSIIHCMWDALDFTHKKIFPFFGCTGILLCLAALILSPDKRKYVFLFGFLFLIFLADTQGGALSEAINRNIFVWMAHWVTMLTNPFKFVLRNFIEYATRALPFLIMPLAVMGIDAIIKCDKKPPPSGRIILLGGGFWGICHCLFPASLRWGPLLSFGHDSAGHAFFNFFKRKDGVFI
jgi:hypothetical protein